jgi:hypothetical protein
VSRKRYPVTGARDEAIIGPTHRARAERATARYLRAVQRGAVSARKDGDRVRQAEQYCEAHWRMRVIEQQIRMVLCEHGVPMMGFIGYFNYGRKLDRHCRHYSGETLRQLAAVALAEACAQGLDYGILVAIRNNVFNVGEPGRSGA